MFSISILVSSKHQTKQLEIDQSTQRSDEVQAGFVIHRIPSHPAVASLPTLRQISKEISVSFLGLYFIFPSARGLSLLYLNSSHLNRRSVFNTLKRIATALSSLPLSFLIERGLCALSHQHLEIPSSSGSLPRLSSSTAPTSLSIFILPAPATASTIASIIPAL